VEAAPEEFGNHRAGGAFRARGDLFGCEQNILVQI